MVTMSIVAANARSILMMLEMIRIPEYMAERIQMIQEVFFFLAVNMQRYPERKKEAELKMPIPTVWSLLLELMMRLTPVDQIIIGFCIMTDYGAHNNLLSTNG